MGRLTFQKRQKEMKRQEKRQLKMQKRAEKKLAKGQAIGEPEIASANESFPEPNDDEIRKA